MRFWVKEHPEFEFDISGKEFTSCDVRAVSKLKNGDLIFVGIHPNDLETKLEKSRTPPFWMNHFGWKRISVYQLAHNGREFIDRNRAADLIQGEKHLAWVLPIIGVGLLVFVFGKYAQQK